MEKEVVRVWFCNRRQKEKRIYCPVASLSMKSHSYNSRMVSHGISLFLSFISLTSCEGNISEWSALPKLKIMQNNKVS